MSIMWLHLDYNYICNEKDIHWNGKGERISLLVLLLPRGKEWTMAGLHFPGDGLWGGPTQKEQIWDVEIHEHSSDSALYGWQPTSSLKLLNLTKAKGDWFCVCAHTCTPVHVWNERPMWHEEVWKGTWKVWSPQLVFYRFTLNIRGTHTVHITALFKCSLISLMTPGSSQRWSNGKVECSRQCFLNLTLHWYPQEYY